MTHVSSGIAVNACLLKIGLEVVPVYGNEKTGWSVEPEDLARRVPFGARYRSLDELFFALVNMNLSVEGEA